MNKRRNDEKTFLAYTRESYIPTVGERLTNFTFLDNGILYDSTHSSSILTVETIANNIYKVETKHTFYIIQVS